MGAYGLGRRVKLQQLATASGPAEPFDLPNVKYDDEACTSGAQGIVEKRAPV
jgi:hypothetical protein